MAGKATDDIDHVIGRRIRDLRKANGLSLETLGNRIDVSYQQIQKYELGRNRVSAATLLRIADGFSVSVSHFLDDETSKGPSAGSLVLARQIDEIQDPEVRAAVSRLVESLAPPTSA